MTDKASEKIPWKRWIAPKIVFAEKVIAANASDTIQQHELKVSRDMVVDYLAVSDDTFTSAFADTSVNQNYLHWLYINWGIVERATWLPVGFGSMEEFHNFFEGDRVNIPISADSPSTTLNQWGPLRWRHSEPWIYNPIDTVSIDVTSPPAPTDITGERFIDVFTDGSGKKTGLRRSFAIRGSRLVQAGGQLTGIPFSQSFSAPQLMANLGDEASTIQSVGVGFPGRGWCMSAPVDQRLLNFYRLRVVPSIGDSWSDTPVPLIFYGIHQGPPWRLAIHKPAGGPLFLCAGQSIIFNFFNDATAAHTGQDQDVDINVQVALIGRTAPGIGSLV